LGTNCLPLHKSLTTSTAKHLNLLGVYEILFS
jgi:hypothetical protein